MNGLLESSGGGELYVPLCCEYITEEFQTRKETGRRLGEYGSNGYRRSVDKSFSIREVENLS